MSILQDFFKTELKLFEGIELAMACASMKISVECVVESLVSRYSKLQKLKQLRPRTIMKNTQRLQRSMQEFN